MSNESLYSTLQEQIRPERLLRMIRQQLSEAEEAFLRKLNIGPTSKGIQACRTFHERMVSTLRELPQLLARFDRRIPCWRSGRWKSLTA